MAKGRLEGAQEEKKRAIRFWDRQNQIREAERRHNDIREDDDNDESEEEEPGDAPVPSNETKRPGDPKNVEASGKEVVGR